MGGGIWDETKAPTGHAEGVVNSRKSRLRRMENFMRLLKYMPPVVKTGTMDIFVTDQLFREGKVAMDINWIGLGEALARSEVLQGVRQAGVRHGAGHCAALTARSCAGARSADSPSC